MKEFFKRGGVRVKICGITNLNDAKAAYDAGADALGFNLFHGSKRYMPWESLSAWAEQVPYDVTRVAVVVNALPDELRAIRENPFFDAIQFHGDESPEDCAREGGGIWMRAIRVDGADAFERALTYASPYVLLDAFAPGMYGGTGVTLDWNAVAGFSAGHEDRFTILAGGLTPETVGEAVSIVRPHAVDVASGVEASPGKKDHMKVAQFIKAAKEA